MREKTSLSRIARALACVLAWPDPSETRPTRPAPHTGLAVPVTQAPSDTYEEHPRTA